MGNDGAYCTIYPVVCFSDGKFPFPIDELSPSLNKLTIILSRLKAQDLCNTKSQYEKFGLLLNVDDVISRGNSEAHNFTICKDWKLMRNVLVLNVRLNI